MVASDIQTVSPSELLPVLTSLLSNPANLREREKAFQHMLRNTGALASLYEIACEKSLSLAVRTLAIIQFKNAIENWRFKRLLSDDDKMRVRTRWRELLNEGDDTIADCNSLIMGKIARFDYPHAWPTMLLDLLELIDAEINQHSLSGTGNESNLIVYRALQMLNKILRELTALKMLTGMKNMALVIEQYADQIVTFYSSRCVAFTPQAFTRESIETSHALQNCRIADLLFKCAAKIATWIWHRLEKLGVDSPGRRQYETWITTFFQNSTSMLQLLVAQRFSIVNSSAIQSVTAKLCIEIITKHILHYGKMFLRMSSLSHVRFVNLPGCDELVRFYWQQVVMSANAPGDLTRDSPVATYPVRLIVQAMVLFRDNLRQRIPERNGSPNPNALSQEAVEEAVNLIITKFMPLKPEDTEGWANDPEEWLTSEDKENEQWEYEIRPCSERVLVTLAVHFSDYITPILMNVFSEISQPVSTMDPTDSFRKEALYAALGLCCRQMKDKIPFTEWINHIVLAEVRKNDNMSRVIKRRVAWLIGKWVREEGPTPNPVLLWEVVLHLLQDRDPVGSDMVVRLTAAEALKDCVNALEFDADLFSSLLPSATAELLGVMGEAQTMECKRRVNDSLNTLITQAELRITPCASIIAQAIHKFWQEDETDWLFKTNMLTTITSLVQAMRESGHMVDLISELITDSLSPQSITHLDEAAFNLWISALRNASSTNFEQSRLLKLFPLILNMPTLAEDLYGRIIDILCSYFLLAGSTLLQVGAKDILQTVTYMMEHTAITNNSRDLLRGVSSLVQTSPSSVWGEGMHVSGFFPYILALLFNAKTSGVVTTEVVYLIARIAMADLQVFSQLMRAAAGPEVTSLENDESLLYKILLDKWWDKFDSIPEPQNRKLSAMAMAALVSTGHPEVMQRLSGEIFNMWTDVFAEVREDQRRLEEEENDEDGHSNNPFQKLYIFDGEGLYSEIEGTAEYTRRRTIYENDPVRIIALKTYVGEAVAHSRSVCGPDFDSKYLADADQAVLAQLMKELS